MAFLTQLANLWPSGQTTETALVPPIAEVDAIACSDNDDNGNNNGYEVAFSDKQKDAMIAEAKVKPPPLSLSSLPSPQQPASPYLSPFQSPLLSPLLGPTVAAFSDFSDLVLTAAQQLSSSMPITTPQQQQKQQHTTDILDAIRVQGQLTNVNQLLLNGNVFFNETRDMIKERAQIERDYAHKMETLATKYRSRMEKKIDPTVWGLHITTDDVIDGDTKNHNDLTDPSSGEMSSKSNDFVSTTKGNTLYHAFNSMLDGIEVAARTRYDFSDTLVTNVAESLRSLALRKDEARARHMQFAQKLELERDRIYSEREKAKARYMERVAEVEAAKQKLERTVDEKTRERAQRQYEQDLADANNLRASNYICLIFIHVANDHKTKYYTEDLPALLTAMQALYVSRSTGLHDLWRICLSLEDATLVSATAHVTAALQAVDDMDPQLDVSRHTNHTQSPNKDEHSTVEPEDFPFEANDPNDTGELIKDQIGKTFLINHCIKIQKKLDTLNAEIKSKEQDVTVLQGQLDELHRESSGHPELADEVNETMLDAVRLITLLKTSRSIVDCERCVILHAIGGALPDDLVAHEFKPASFTIPTACDYCAATIWGISKQGYSCKDCGYNCHTKCEMKVYPDCTKRPGGHLERLAKPTIAIATVLYDYDANTEQELSVNAGGIVTVIEPDMGTGWVRVELNGQEGIVPASYVQLDPDAVLQPEYVQALYDYQARTDVELSMYAGAVIEVTNRNCAEGWWEGTLDGQTGQFPINYVTEYTVTADYDAVAQSD
ncbi:hypothetical protein BDF19DRAFT_419578 [Syncephalis fuscata]|nr:hypothetical protein BDF19DRAFT_419578 [Syncephalis fuscata]